ncbi:hypothetical protein EP7_002471 [Isosphaeraceae bacterium EP7]
MLYLSLTVSTVFFLIANGLAASVSYRGVATLLVVAFLMIGLSLPILFLPALSFQAVLTSLAAVAWYRSRRGPSFFLKASCLATVAAYGLAGGFVLASNREYDRLRSMYPYESMEDRAPSPKPVPGGTILSPDAIEGLSVMDRAFEEQRDGHGLLLHRDWILKQLHEDTISLFINSPGFGVTRNFLPNEYRLKRSMRIEKVPLQPASRKVSTWSPGVSDPLAAADQGPMWRLLESSIVDFANSGRNGLIKDRRHVAGFEPHKFSQIPDGADHWAVRNIELVGLLLHDEPVAYVSDHLPKMDKLHNAPTRPLDRFESYGLESLRQGEDIVSARDGEVVRMLGAVRSAKQCVVCHGGSRGDLLGAFSYVLGAAEATPAKVEPMSAADSPREARPAAEVRVLGGP